MILVYRVSNSILKIQYEFIHQALSELVVCGETEVTASGLRSFTESLSSIEGGTGGISKAQKHFQVLQLEI